MNGFSDSQSGDDIKVATWYGSGGVMLAASGGPKDGSLVVVMPTIPQRDAGLLMPVVMPVGVGEVCFGRYVLDGGVHYHPMYGGAEYPLVAETADQFAGLYSDELSFMRDVLGLELNLGSFVDVNVANVILNDMPRFRSQAGSASKPSDVGAAIHANILGYLREFAEFHDMWEQHHSGLHGAWAAACGGSVSVH